VVKSWDPDEQVAGGSASDVRVTAHENNAGIDACRVAIERIADRELDEVLVLTIRASNVKIQSPDAFAGMS
jgi:hypothetical protein